MGHHGMMHAVVADIADLSCSRHRNKLIIRSGRTLRSAGDRQIGILVVVLADTGIRQCR